MLKTENKRLVKCGTGPNSYVLYVPAKWAKLNEILNGTEVQVVYSDNFPEVLLTVKDNRAGREYLKDFKNRFEEEVL